MKIPPSWFEKPSMRVEFVIGALVTTAFWAVIELFYRSDTSGLWEVIKLIVQFVGALMLAWLTVEWALRRFKSEKMWERRTTALADVLTALRDMDRVNDEWLDDYYKQQDVGPERDAKLSERLTTARKKFENVASIAMIILPAPSLQS
jgi:hypothetical protein